MGKKQLVSTDTTDLAFRLLFSLIFLALGMEHLLNGPLIHKLFPSWVPYPYAVSILCSVPLLVGGSLVALGYRLKLAATLLGAFIVLVTATVHAPALFAEPDFMQPQDQWIWQILQRSNYVKNLCLLGVCMLLLTHTPGRWSLQAYLKRRVAPSDNEQDLT